MACMYQINAVLRVRKNNNLPEGSLPRSSLIRRYVDRNPMLLPWKTPAAPESCRCCPCSPPLPRTCVHESMQRRHTASFVFCFLMYNTLIVWGVWYSSCQICNTTEEEEGEKKKAKKRRTKKQDKNKTIGVFNYHGIVSPTQLPCSSPI